MNNHSLDNPTACNQAQAEPATNCYTPPRDWKEIITLLFDMSDTTKKDKAEAERYRKTAEVLQCLNENNGSEREKEAFFKDVEPIYQLYLQMDDKFKQALAKDAQNGRARRAKSAEWERLPFLLRSRACWIVCTFCPNLSNGTCPTFQSNALPKYANFTLPLLKSNFQY
ncbi:hypothetical protein KZ326_11525 [Glaesserella parasuis]|nr:hypothetical protein [Glaesserella parasuis]